MRFVPRAGLALAAVCAPAWIALLAPDVALARACFQPDEIPLESHQHYHSRSDGCDVHGPAKTRDGAKPEGASAKCRDGTWSFSHTRSGTCSRHGGVERWESGGLQVLVPMGNGPASDGTASSRRREHSTRPGAIHPPVSAGCEHSDELGIPA